MKYSVIDLNEAVKYLDGKPAKSSADTDLTVKDAIRRALNNPYQDEQPTAANPMAGQAGSTGLSVEDRIKRYDISKRLMRAESTLELSVEEVAEVKKVVAKFFPEQEIVGFLFEFLETQALGDKLASV